MAMTADALSLYNDLKSKRIATGEVDMECLSDVLNSTLYELKHKKASAFVNRLYTACMQYAYFPDKNKKTMTEIRVKPENMGLSGTDAMIILEMLSMKIENVECENTEKYKDLSSKLFTSYVMKPNAVKSRLGREVEDINRNLCQKIALAHFGQTANLDDVPHRDKPIVKADTKEAVKEMVAEVTGTEKNAINTDELDKKAEEKIAGMLKSAMEKCNAMTEEAKKQAAAMIEQARTRTRTLAEGTKLETNDSLKKILSTLGDANKTVLDIQSKIDSSYVQGFAHDMLEVYNIIADSRDSMTGKKETEECRVTLNNLDAYLGMIEDILEKYGVARISSGKGAKFDGKIHEVKDSNDFDPKKANIKESLRSGFMIDSVVMQKERVSVGK